ncbi:MAG: PEP-CTERM sorting domain-containing protein [Kiritimatiellae bacterium]|nr:PEP-CTERM sorting domain-containing protein [Kiritimatiellia bacterium]
MTIRGLSCVVALAIAGASEAGIRINWNSPANTFYQQNGVTLIPNQSLFFAFWSPDTTMGVNPASLENPTGGDIFLGARNMNLLGTSSGRITGYASGDYFQESSYSLPPDAFVPGYVYIVFFNFPYSSYMGPGSIPLGTHFGVAPLTPFGGLSDADPSGGPPPPPDVVNYGGISYMASQSLIPEPSAAVMVLVGAGAAIWFRRRRMENA